MVIYRSFLFGCSGFILPAAAGLAGEAADALLLGLAACILLAAAIADQRTREIPLALNGALLLLGILRVWSGGVPAGEAVLGAFCVSLPLEVLLRLTRGRAIGGGDVKLTAAGGLLVGWRYCLLAFWIGGALAVLFQVPRLGKERGGHTIAFGPYLAAGFLLIFLWGDEILRFLADKF
ncbi:MAG: A24 family peptidase [Lachnospiraceae bacterium]|nr:A24 family peptidase [Lachnospiraceae bacterium]